MKAALLALCTIGFVAAQDGSLGRGFGDSYAWYGMADGLAEAKASKKPTLMVFHKTKCGACKRLGPEFAKSKELQEAAKDFVMINCADSDEGGCKDSAYKPDGSYVPRILFATPNGKVLTDVKTPGGNPDYLYFYTRTNQITQSMKQVLAASDDDEEL